jgi:hypothetical protein
MIRNDQVEFEAALTFATNAGNLRLELSDYLENPQNAKKKVVEKKAPAETEIEIER